MPGVSQERECADQPLSLTELFKPQASDTVQGQIPMRSRISWGDFPHSKAKASDLMRLVLMFM